MPQSDLRLEELAEFDSVPTEPTAPPAGPVIALRFRIETDPVGLDALRHARRALLREEATRGLDPDEPSLEQATFSPTDIVWEIRPTQRTRCLEKLEELVCRARRARDNELSFSDTASRRSTRTSLGE